MPIWHSEVRKSGTSIIIRSKAVQQCGLLSLDLLSLFFVQFYTVESLFFGNPTEDFVIHKVLEAYSS